MGASTQPSAVSDDIDEFFEPALETSEDDMDDAPTRADNKAHLAELRRRAELRLERKRLQEELGYYDLDWQG